MPKYRISLPEAPDEEYEIDAPDGADFDEIENEIRQKRAQEKSASAAKKALDKVVEPVTTQKSVLGRPIGTDDPNANALKKYGTNALEGVAGPLSAFVGGLKYGGPIGGLVNAALDTGLNHTIGSGRTTPADVLMNLIPSPPKPLDILSKVPGLRALTRKAPDEKVLSAIPDATPYASALRQRLSNTVRGSVPGMAEGLARGSAHRALSGEDPSLQTNDALLGGTAGAISGLTSVKPIAATKAEQVYKKLGSLEDKLHTLDRGMTEELKKKAAAQRTIEKLESSATAKVRPNITEMQKELAQRQAAVSSGEAELNDLMKSRAPARAAAAKAPTTPPPDPLAEAEKINKQQKQYLAREIKKEREKLEELSSAKPPKPSGDATADAAADKALTQSRTKSAARIAQLQGELDNLNASPTNIRMTRQAQAKVDKLADAQIAAAEASTARAQLSQYDTDIQQKFAALDKDKASAKELSDLISRQTSVAPDQFDSYVKRLADDFMASTPAGPRTKMTLSDKRAKAQDAIRKGDVKEIDLMLQSKDVGKELTSVAKLLKKDSREAMLKVAADLVASSYMAVPTGTFRAALNGLGHVIQNRDSEGIAQFNKGLSKIIGSKAARAVGNSMQATINAFEGRARAKEEERESRKAALAKSEAEVEEEEASLPAASSRQELLDAIATQEGYYDEKRPDNRARRNKNPGNLRGNEGFYMYPSDEEGFAALGDLLQRNSGKTLAAYIAQHASASDNNDPEAYTRNVIKRLREKGIEVDENTLIEQLLAQ